MSTCSFGISQMASSDLHKRKSQSKKDRPDSEADKSSSNEPGVLQGMLPCVAGVAGISLFIWLIFFLYVPPEIIKGNSLCTRVNDPVSLISDLKAVTNWQSFARELGVPENELAVEGGSEQKIGQILRIWSKRAGVPCWEKLVNTLNKLEETTLAEKLSNKYQATTK